MYRKLTREYIATLQLKTLISTDVDRQNLLC